MAKKIISEFSKQLSKEISERKIYDLTEISGLIESRLNFCIKDLMLEYSTQEENEYIKLLNEQSKNKVGSVKYISLGYKLSAAKQKKAAANRAADIIRREDEYKKLRDFIISRFGQEILDEFFNQKDS